MRLTIIRDDGIVGVDGVFREVDLSSLDANIHAVQWDGAMGHVEYKEPKSEEPISSYKARFAAFVDLWKAAAPPVEITPPPTAIELRRGVMPSDTEQLGALWTIIEAAGLPVPSEARAVLKQVNDAITRFPE